MHRKPWRVSELQLLIEGIRGARSPSEICVPGRSESALRSMARKLKLVGDGVPRARWTPEQKQSLAELIASGMKATTIARQGLLSGFNRNAIQKQMQRMGLGHPRRSRPQKSAARFTGKSLDRFHAFLRANARGCTPMQIVQIWNEDHEPKVSHARVLYHLGQLGLRLARRVVIKMAYSREKQRLGTQQFIEREKLRRELLWRQEPLRLRKLADELQAQAAADGNGCRLRTCPECNETWPARAEFFHVMSKAAPDGKRFYTAKVCRLCRNRQRRERDRMGAMPQSVLRGIGIESKPRIPMPSSIHELPRMSEFFPRPQRGEEIIAARNWPIGSGVGYAVPGSGR